MPVDLYVGGAEHAVLHLLYARFWHKVLFDIGVVSTPEPFMKLVHQGMILGEDGSKMSKSAGNVVNPDEMFERFGADAVRIYEMFMGPLEAIETLEHEQRRRRDALPGSRVAAGGRGGREPEPRAAEGPPAPEARCGCCTRPSARSPRTSTGCRFNTAIAQMMVFVNELTPLERACPRALIEPLVLVLSPFAPHLCEELWQRLGHDPSLAYAPWPAWDPALVVEETVTVAVQVNGKLRGDARAAARDRPGRPRRRRSPMSACSRHVNGGRSAR